MGGEQEGPHLHGQDFGRTWGSPARDKGQRQARSAVQSLGGSRGVPVLVPVRASPVPSVVRGSLVVKFFCSRLHARRFQQGCARRLLPTCARKLLPAADPLPPGWLRSDARIRSSSRSLSNQFETSLRCFIGFPIASAAANSSE